jgi:hypothetical protein
MQQPGCKKYNFYLLTNAKLNTPFENYKFSYCYANEYNKFDAPVS